MIKNINIANNGMQAGLLIGFSMYQKEISDLIPKKVYDEESIHSTLYFFANGQHFILDDFQVKEKEIYCELKEEIVGQGREILMGNENYRAKIKLPEIAKRNERIMGLIFEACQVIWNYKKINFKVSNWKENYVGAIEVDLEKFSDLYFSKRKAEKVEYDSCILSNTFIEDSSERV